MFDTAFQFVGVPLAAIFAVAALWRWARRVGSRRASMFWAVIWSFAAVAIAAPDVTTMIARSVGIARGADLLLYCAVLAGFVGFWLVSVQLRRTQRELTLLTRAVAIEQATKAPGVEDTGRDR
ncbi:MAG TPA: hypothetical protein DCQ06_03415 [Myxococcales bacterium]|nr:hypothetical protein [Myxococcales bacterium]HAN30625.1 hypothetical protein [Myxococcales bacterium]